MARTRRNSKIDTRSARAKLPNRREPYWQTITPGCAVGYRKGKEGGTWIARRYDPSATPRMRYSAIGAADDFMDGDGNAALSFAQAQERAREWFKGAAAEVHGEEPQPAGPYTVGQALDAYLAKLEDEGKSSLRDARPRVNALIRPALGTVDIRRLTAAQLQRFLKDQAAAPARLRTRKGEKQKHRAVDTDEAKRARRSSANRTWTTLRAALNLAFDSGKVASNTAWRRVKGFKGADAARVRYLSVAEAQRLLNASSGAFRDLVAAALATGARYGELVRLDVADFNADAGTLAIRHSKSGKGRHVFLTDEGRNLFTRHASGRPARASLLLRDDGKRWESDDQARPMRAAVEGARLDAISFHGLRHTYASLAIMNGAPLNVVAHNLGHADTRMVEKHYGHLAPSYVAETIRAKAPTFGMKPDGKVTILKRKRRAP